VAGEGLELRAESLEVAQTSMDENDRVTGAEVDVAQSSAPDASCLDLGEVCRVLLGVQPVLNAEDGGSPYQVPKGT